VHARGDNTVIAKKSKTPESYNPGVFSIFPVTVIILL